MKIAAISCLVGLLALGCDDPQYVNPDTVALIVTNESTGVERVHRCHFVPVLLGSQDKARYLVEDQLRVTLTLTREDVSVMFEESGEMVGRIVVDSRQLTSDVTIEIEEAPTGFRAQLVSPCVPDDFF